MASEENTGEPKKMHVIFAEFDAWIHESGELFDTTHEDLAKENNIFNDKAVYEPLPLLIGSDRLFAGLDKSMQDAELGKEYEITIPPEDAAGPRDPKLVDLLPMREFLKQEIVPEVGMQVTVKGKAGYVSAVTAGRVRVDFNNKLAGKTLRYKYKLISEPKEKREIFDAIMKMDYGNPEGFSADFEEDKVIVKLPDVCKYDQKWLLSKYRVVMDLREVLDLDIIQFIEEYTKSEKKEEKPQEIQQQEELKAEEKEKEEPNKDRPEEEIVE